MATLSFLISKMATLSSPTNSSEMMTSQQQRSLPSFFSSEDLEVLRDRSGHRTLQVDCQAFPTAEPIGVDYEEWPPNGQPSHGSQTMWTLMAVSHFVDCGWVVAEVWDLALGGAFLIGALKKLYRVLLGLACSQWQILQGSVGSVVSVYQQPTQNPCSR